MQELMNWLLLLWLLWLLWLLLLGMPDMKMRGLGVVLVWVYEGPEQRLRQVRWGQEIQSCQGVQHSRHLPGAHQGKVLLGLHSVCVCVRGV